MFENFVPEISHPFEGGDILIDRTKVNPLPFVFDRCVTWTLEDEEEAQQKMISYCEKSERMGLDAGECSLRRHIDLEECDDALFDRCNAAGCCYCSHGHMFAYGYEIDLSLEGALLDYNWTGASDNYLNLEYYGGPLAGKLNILPTVSWFVMNEMRSARDFDDVLAAEDRANNKFKDRGIKAPDAATYDICSLVNGGFRLG